MLSEGIGGLGEIGGLFKLAGTVLTVGLLTKGLEVMGCKNKRPQHAPSP